MDWKISLLILSILTFLSGLLLLLFSKQVRRLAVFLNRWFSLRVFLKPLDMMISMDDKIYRMHKILGGISLLLAVIFFIIQFRMDHQFFKNIAISLVILNFLAAVTFLLFHRVLKKWDIDLNKWFSLRKFLKPLELIRSVENEIYKAHKVFGILSLILSLIIFCWWMNLKAC
nr:hypothetical protein [Candidatus Omnitrophota bacterium]